MAGNHFSLPDPPNPSSHSTYRYRCLCWKSQVHPLIGALRRLDPTSVCGLTNPNMWSTSLLSHFFFFFAGYMHMHACMYFKLHTRKSLPFSWLTLGRGLKSWDIHRIFGDWYIHKLRSYKNVVRSYLLQDGNKDPFILERQGRTFYPTKELSRIPKARQSCSFLGLRQRWHQIESLPLLTFPQHLVSSFLWTPFYPQKIFDPSLAYLRLH